MSHVLSKVLGGGLVDNIIAQNPRINTGAYARLAREVAREMRHTGNATHIEINLFYAGAEETRPTTIVFNANVGGKLTL